MPCTLRKNAIYIVINTSILFILKNNEPNIAQSSLLCLSYYLQHSFLAIFSYYRYKLLD